MQLHEMNRHSANALLSSLTSTLSLGILFCANAIPTQGQQEVSNAVADSNSTGTVSEAPLSAPSATQDPLAYSNDRVKVKVSIAGVAQASGVTGSWWNLSDTFAPSANYKPDRAWGESWIKPGVTTEFRLNDTAHIYSGLSYVGSGTSAVMSLNKGIEDCMPSKMATSACVSGIAINRQSSICPTGGSLTRLDRAC